jgi:hypothetical protein
MKQLTIDYMYMYNNDQAITLSSALLVIRKFDPRFFFQLFTDCLFYAHELEACNSKLLSYALRSNSYFRTL